MISVHGGDVLGVAERWRGGRAAVAGRVRAPRSSRSPTRARSPSAAARSARDDVRVVHLGTDVPPPAHTDVTTLVTVGNLIARKRHGDVLRALWLLRDEHPELHYVIVGDGPERARARAARARARARASGSRSAARCRPRRRSTVARWGGDLRAAERRRGVRRRLHRGDGGRDPRDRLARRARAGGDRGAAAAGCGSSPPGDPEALARELRTLLEDAACRRELGAAARANVEANFTWERCGRATVAAYEDALR